jgi:glycosyltransferase involved in cell wall biosynthesis
VIFVVPDVGAMISGGNVYNAGLTAALRALPDGVHVVDLERGEAMLREGHAGRYWVDSLYMEAMPRLRALAPQASLGLLVHYLPSLVTRGAVPAAGELSEQERAALSAADRFLVPSTFMAHALARLGVQPTRIQVVAPAIVAPEVAPARGEASGVRALVVANLVPGKGVLPFLDALAPRLAGVPLEVAVIGAFTHDPEYAAACRLRVEGRDAVRFLGPVPHATTLRHLAESHLLVSASRMESFGMVLGEARALGVPILAHAGGNAAAHVAERSGGRLVESHAELAEECVRLARTPDELAERRRLAQAARPPARTWSDAARELANE